MELKLAKIYRHGEDNAMVHISIEASYGYDGAMYKDVIQINYNGKKREAFITARLQNPGTGTVVERMIEAVTAVDYSSAGVKHPPLRILETLAERLSLRFDSDVVKQALSNN